MKTKITNTGETAIVTGATGAIGSEIALVLAQRGHHVILACRNSELGEALRERLVEETGNRQIEVMLLDLEQRQSIRNFVNEIEKRGVRINYLANNAGVLRRKYAVNEDGVEKTFAVNLVGTLLFTIKLIPFMVAGGHVGFTTSVTRYLHSAKTLDINETEENFSQLGTYGRSKTAMTHFAQYLAHCHRDMYINCADPGIVDSKMLMMHRWFDGLTKLVFSPFARSAQKGAQAMIRALDINETGKVTTPSRTVAIPYEPHGTAHAHIVEKIRKLLVDLGAELDEQQ